MEMLANKSLLEMAGSKVTQTGPIEEIFHNSQLDWNVLQTPVESSVVDVRNAVINYRSDTKDVLGIVSESHYNVVNNIEAFKFIDSLENFKIESVGLANKGKQVFVVGRGTDSFEIDSGDYVQQYINFVHGHDGKRGIQLLICPIRMFCMNQFNLALKTSSFKYAIRHDKNVESKLSKIQDALKNNHMYMNDLNNTLKGLINKKPSIALDDFLETLFKKETTSLRSINRMDEMIDSVTYLYNNKDDNQNYKGTSFGYLNAVADFLSHQNPGRYVDENTYENNFIKILNNNKVLDDAYQILKAA